MNELLQEVEQKADEYLNAKQLADEARRAQDKASASYALAVSKLTTYITVHKAATEVTE